MTYKEYRDREQKAVNDLPLFFAFSNAQFDEAMKERGLDPDSDLDKIMRVKDFGLGCFALKKDKEVLDAYFTRPDDLVDLMKNTEFAEEAFYYEMANHEYHINGQADLDVCSCFCNCEYGAMKTYEDYLAEAGYGDDVIQSFENAKRRFYNDCEKNNWW